jgi:hypothetical protein
MTPDRGVVKALKRIDPKLSVRFVEKCGRWGVFHDAPYPAQVDKTVSENAVKIQLDLLQRGYVVTKACAEEYAWLQLQDYTLVFYVTEEDGSYRPLDNRVIEKMMRMDSFRKNFGVEDWKRYMNAKAQIQKDLREKAWEDYNQYAHKDKVYKQQMAEALRGDPHLRSVNVTQPDRPPRYSLEALRAEREGEVDAATECGSKGSVGKGVCQASAAAGA